MNLRPGETSQYAAAVSGFDEPGPDGRPLRFRFGYIASSDNHSARPGTGYKQVGRHGMTDARGMASPFYERSHASLDPGPSRRRRARAAGARAGAGPARPARRGARRELHVPRRPGRVAQPGPQPRRDLGRPPAPRGLRHQRAPHPAVVRLAGRGGRPPAHGIGDRERQRAALRGARGGLAACSSPVVPKRAARRWGTSAWRSCVSASATTRATSGVRSRRSRSSGSAHRRFRASRWSRSSRIPGCSLPCVPTRPAAARPSRIPTTPALAPRRGLLRARPRVTVSGHQRREPADGVRRPGQAGPHDAMPRRLPHRARRRLPGAGAGAGLVVSDLSRLAGSFPVVGRLGFVVVSRRLTARGGAPSRSSPCGCSRRRARAGS